MTSDIPTFQPRSWSAITLSGLIFALLFPPLYRLPVGYENFMQFLTMTGAPDIVRPLKLWLLPLTGFTGIIPNIVLAGGPALFVGFLYGGVIGRIDNLLLRTACTASLGWLILIAMRAILLVYALIAFPSAFTRMIEKPFFGFFSANDFYGSVAAIACQIVCSGMIWRFAHRKRKPVTN